MDNEKKLLKTAEKYTNVTSEDYRE